MIFPRLTDCGCEGRSPLSLTWEDPEVQADRDSSKVHNQSGGGLEIEPRSPVSLFRALI